MDFLHIWSVNVQELDRTGCTVTGVVMQGKVFWRSMWALFQGSFTSWSRLLHQEAFESPPQLYLPLAPPVQPALQWLHYLDTPPLLLCLFLTQAPPAAGERPGYAPHVLFKQVSFLLTHTGGEGCEGQESCWLPLVLKPFLLPVSSLKSSWFWSLLSVILHPVIRLL